MINPAIGYASPDRVPYKIAAMSMALIAINADRINQAWSSQKKAEFGL